MRARRRRGRKNGSEEGDRKMMIWFGGVGFVCTDFLASFPLDICNRDTWIQERFPS